MLSQVETSIPPLIAQHEWPIAPGAAVLAEEAVREITLADAEAGPQSAALNRFMIRNESIASSKIEQMDATGDDFARAVAGSRANASATGMVAATHAIQDLIRHVGTSSQFSLEMILEAHAALMSEDEDPSNRAWAGRIREDQNWLGGSDHSPRSAVYVPPPPDYLDDLLEDLIRFANREDLPTLVQAAVLHAQFESIHPFTDGNGRIGRALINAVLQRRGLTHHALLPMASGLAALRQDYFAALGAYRTGELGPMFDLLARASIAAAQEARVSFVRLRAMPESWRVELARRADSAAARVLEQIFESPTLTAEDFVRLTGGSTSSAYGAIDVLADAGIIREVTGRKRDRIWVVSDIVDELDDLDLRIRARLAGGG